MPTRTLVRIGKVVRISLLVFAGLFLTACAQNARAPNAGDIAGVYRLVAVDGSTVPATVSHGESPVRVRSGTFTINADGTCTSRVLFGPPSGDASTREVRATYTRKGSDLHMKWIGAGRTVGTVDGDRFTINNEGMIFAYEKVPAPPAPGE